ncbi:MAG: hypothetical protein ACREMB_07570 [Candidatus Rokuibacteriota bacterium]
MSTGALPIVSWAAALVLCLAPGATASALRVKSEMDLHALYQRLEPGMTVEQVAATAADGSRLAAAAPPVTAWLVWTPAVPGRPTAVLRASFRDGRLLRLEYEVFGEEYHKVAKGEDPEVEVSPEDLTRLRRRSAKLERVADGCRQTVEAYHRLVLGAQNRLTREEQAAWVRALELRRAVDAHLSPSSLR